MGGWAISLGRPGSERELDLPPNSISVDDGPIAVRQRNLAGGLLKSVVSPYVPTVQINSTKLILEDRNFLASLANMNDTFVSLIARDNDYRVILQRIIPTPTEFKVFLPPSSITRLDKALDDVSATTLINITGVFTTADEGGTDVFSGGSYLPQTREVVLGSPLGSDDDVWVSYTYSGWLMELQSFPHVAVGGLVDIWNYDFQLVGA